MSSPKVDLAINLVKGLIQSGEIRPGDRLPNEADLSAQLGISRNSLREAVRALQAMRILEARQGDGTYVCDLDPVGMIDVLRFAVDVSDTQAVVWFLEIRRTLEVSAVRRAASRRSVSELDQLKAIQSRILKTTDNDLLMQLDSDFHLAIADIAGNPIQSALLKVVSAPTLRARIWRQRLADMNFANLRHEHDRILAGIEEQDVESAVHAMWGHVDGVLQWAKTHPEDIAMPIIDMGQSPE